MRDCCFTSSEINYAIELCVLCTWADSHACPRWTRICWSIICVILATAAEHPASGSSEILLWFCLFLKDQKLYGRNIWFCHLAWPIFTAPVAFVRFHRECLRTVYVLSQAFSVSEQFPYPMNLSLNQCPYNKQDRKQRPCVDCRDYMYISMLVLNIMGLKANPMENSAWTNLIKH